MGLKADSIETLHGILNMGLFWPIGADEVIKPWVNTNIRSSAARVEFAETNQHNCDPETPTSGVHH